MFEFRVNRAPREVARFIDAELPAAEEALRTGIRNGQIRTTRDLRGAFEDVVGAEERD